MGILSRSPGWLPRAGVWLLIALYSAIWAFSGVQKLNITDFEAFFLPSARIALAGHPLHIYQVRYQDVYPNANGPLSIVPLTLAAWLARLAGWLDNMELRRMVAMSIFSVFPLLMAREAVLAADRLLQARLRGYWRLLAYALFALTPELWHSVLLYGHIEQPIMIWLTLAGVRALTERRWTRGGVFIGLAMLSRSVALLYLLTLALTLLCRRHAVACIRFVGGALATVTLGLLPFWLADRADLTYSLMTFRTLLPVSGGSFWAISIRTPLESFATQYDSATVIVGVIVASLLLLGLHRTLDVTSADIYALLAIADLCFPLLIKTLWPYYFLDAYVFVALWWLAQARTLKRGAPHSQSGARVRIAYWLAGFALPVAVIGAAQLAEYGLSQLVNGDWQIQWSMADLVAIVLLQVALGVLIVLRRHLSRHDESSASVQDGEMPSGDPLAYTLTTTH